MPFWQIIPIWLLHSVICGSRTRSWLEHLHVNHCDVLLLLGRCK